MLLNKTSTLGPSIMSSFDRFSKTKVPVFHNNDHKMRCSARNVGEVGIPYKGYHYFPSLHHPLELDLPNLQADDDNDDGGIGIVRFFQGKNVFITGATGLVGKAFIEKLLRSTPVGKIYLLIKAKDKAAALERLENEIIKSELFKCLREAYGNSYEEFIKEKLIPVVGNICEPNLGMDSESTQAIKDDVDIIVQSAASTALNDRYDVLLNINVNAPQRLMRFASNRCKHIKLFVHISTAYVNGRREGLIREKPLMMGENGKKENDNETNPSSFPRLDLADEISLAMNYSCRSTSHDHDATKDLRKLGQERANMFGWCNAYHMTKAMAEMVLNEMRGDIPLLIIRPTVIESSYKEPIPGWIQGNRMFDPFIISFGKGHLPAFLADPDIHMDIIPLDMVVNSTIAAIAKHGMVNKPQLNVYHVGSGVQNPLRFSEFFEIIHEYTNLSPNNISKIKLFNDFSNFSKYTRDEIYMTNAVGVDDENNIEKSKKQNKVKVVYVERLCKMYEFIGFYKGRFRTDNIQKLLQEMSKEEQLTFEVDVTNIDWRKYFMDIHIPGLIKHVLNGRKI